MFKRIYISAIIGMGFLQSCKMDSTNIQVLENIPPSHSGVDFMNKLHEDEGFNINDYIYYYNGAGVAVADFNGDSLIDIFFTANETSCRLYLNKGDFKFQDVTVESGLTTSFWATGATITDINGDAFPDIYVCSAGHKNPADRRNRLFVHQGNKEGSNTPYFIEMAEEYGIADTSHSTQAAFFDYDRDGNLDLYIMNHGNDRSSVNTPLPIRKDQIGPTNDKLFRNDGNGRFKDYTFSAGIIGEGYGLGLSIGDFNRDGWMDIFVANDFIYGDHLWINQKDGTFKDEASIYFALQSYNSMGSDLGDINNDGYEDLIVLDMLPSTLFKYKTMGGSMNYYKWDLMIRQGYPRQYMRNTLQLNNGLPDKDLGYSFLEIGRMAGVSATDWSWGPLWMDIDNDGFQDLYVTNGYLRDITDQDFIDYSSNLILFDDQEKADEQLLGEIKQLEGYPSINKVFKNKGNGVFVDLTESWTSGTHSFSNGSAYADLDNDGALDLIFNNINNPPTILRNNCRKHRSDNYLGIRLTGPPNNSMGIGAKVEVVTQDNQQTRSQILSRGYLSSVSPVLHFGIGQDTGILSIGVTWANGDFQEIKDLEVNQVIDITYDVTKKDIHSKIDSVKQTLSCFTEISEKLAIQFDKDSIHYPNINENPLLHRNYSSKRTVLAVGDINRDGLDDFFAGGNGQNPGAIFYQTVNGSFTPHRLDGITSHCSDAVIHDFNCDGFLDLFILQFGHERMLSLTKQVPVYFENNGAGSLERKKIEGLDEAPGMQTIALGQQDSYIDLFMASGVKTDAYPQTRSSQIWRIKCGRWENISHTIAEDPADLGIVTDATWCDMTGNGIKELIIVGEWLPIQIFEWKNGIFEINDKIVLPERGWWNSVTCTDINADGYNDVLAGNEGLNTRFISSDDQPIKLYIADYDQNGKAEALLAIKENRDYYPVYKRNDLLRQVSGLALKFPKHKMYASTTMENLLREENSSAKLVLKANTFETSIYMTNGYPDLIKLDLPRMVQASPIQKLIAHDFNEDGICEVLLLGNDEQKDLEIGMQLGWNGKILTIHNEVPTLENDFKTGLYQKGQITSAEVLYDIHDNPLLIVASFSGDIKLYKYNKLNLDHLQ